MGTPRIISKTRKQADRQVSGQSAQQTKSRESASLLESDKKKKENISQPERSELQDVFEEAASTLSDEARASIQSKIPGWIKALQAEGVFAPMDMMGAVGDASAGEQEEGPLITAELRGQLEAIGRATKEKVPRSLGSRLAYSPAPPHPPPPAAAATYDKSLNDNTGRTSLLGESPFAFHRRLVQVHEVTTPSAGGGALGEERNSGSGSFAYSIPLYLEKAEREVLRELSSAKEVKAEIPFLWNCRLQAPGSVVAPNEQSLFISVEDQLKEILGESSSDGSSPPMMETVGYSLSPVLGGQHSSFGCRVLRKQMDPHVQGDTLQLPSVLWDHCGFSGLVEGTRQLKLIPTQSLAFVPTDVPLFWGGHFVGFAFRQPLTTGAEGVRVPVLLSSFRRALKDALSHHR